MPGFFFKIQNNFYHDGSFKSCEIQKELQQGKHFWRKAFAIPLKKIALVNLFQITKGLKFFFNLLSESDIYFKL